MPRCTSACLRVFSDATSPCHRTLIDYLTCPHLLLAAPASFDKAYRDYAQCVARWARTLGGTEIEVEDAVQEVFMVVSRRLRDFRGEARFTSWLFEITRKTVANHRRRHRWRFWTGKPDATDSTISPALDPAAEFEQRRAVALFYEALDHLPEKYRTALVLFEVEGMSTQAIADLLDLRLSNVKIRLSRARQRFLARYQRLLNGDRS